MQHHAYSLTTNFTSKFSNARMIRPYTLSPDKRDTATDRRYSLGVPSRMLPAVSRGPIWYATPDTRERPEHLYLSASTIDDSCDPRDDLKVLTDAYTTIDSCDVDID